MGAELKHAERIVEVGAIYGLWIEDTEKSQFFKVCSSLYLFKGFLL